MAEAPRRKIKPAGWVVIVLALGGLGWWAWTKVGPALVHLAEEHRSTENPATPEAPTTVTTPAQRVVPRALLPAAAPALPSPTGAAARVALPALAAVEMPPAGALPAPSEREALRLVARGEADSAIVSVAALASEPSAIAHGVKAIWYLGDDLADAALTSCDPAALRKERLGAVRGSLGQVHLLAALAGEPLPDVELFDRDVELARAFAEKTVTAGPTHHANAPEICGNLPHSAFALVVVHQAGNALTPAQLAAVARLSKLPPPTPEEVAAFFDRDRAAPGGFRQIFDAESSVWRAAGMIDRTASARAALDRTFVQGAPEEAPTQQEESPTARQFGYPSWADPH